MRGIAENAVGKTVKKGKLDFNIFINGLNATSFCKNA
jgi:hypothetical protein